MAEIPLQNSSQQKKPQKTTYVGNDPRDGLGRKTMLRGHKCAEIGRLYLIKKRDVPGTKEIRKYRDLPHPLTKGRWAKMKAIQTVPFIVAQCPVHGRRNLYLLHVGDCALNVPVMRKVLQHFKCELDMSSPTVARLETLSLLHPIPVIKLYDQIFAVLTSHVHLVTKGHQISPDCAIAPQRSSTVVKPLQFAHGTGNEPPQRQMA
jgi:hypothetical protein